jgi:hypothetical protein
LYEVPGARLDSETAALFIFTAAVFFGFFDSRFDLFWPLAIPTSADAVRTVWLILYRQEARKLRRSRRTNCHPSTVRDRRRHLSHASLDCGSGTSGISEAGAAIALPLNVRCSDVRSSGRTKLRGNRILGATIFFVGAILMGMAYLAADTPADQLDDPLVGHLAKNTILYLFLATDALLSGAIVAVFGGPSSVSASRDARTASLRPQRSARNLAIASRVPG